MQILYGFSIKIRVLKKAGIHLACTLGKQRFMLRLIHVVCNCEHHSFCLETDDGHRDDDATGDSPSDGHGQLNHEEVEGDDGVPNGQLLAACGLALQTADV